MKKIEPILNFNLSNAIGDKINNHLSGLNRYNKADEQKQLELCQVGKFLATFFPAFQIEEVREQPDFIISNGKEKFGLEHESIINENIKQKQGFYENIFHLAERDLQDNDRLPNFLANCYLKNDLCFQTSDKNMLIQTVKSTVESLIIDDNIPENPIIEKIFIMPHTQKNLNINFGAHMIQNLTEEIIGEFIKRKEVKIEVYKNNTDLKQWLLLLAGGVNEYSYDIEEKLIINNINTRFSKVFLFADFDNKLYELK